MHSESYLVRSFWKWKCFSHLFCIDKIQQPFLKTNIISLCLPAAFSFLFVKWILKLFHAGEWLYKWFGKSINWILVGNSVEMLGKCGLIMWTVWLCRGACAFVSAACIHKSICVYCFYICLNICLYICNSDAWIYKVSMQIFVITKTSHTMREILSPFNIVTSNLIPVASTPAT